MWARCSGEGGLVRDPFGWSGPESERPWVWGTLADARANYEAQERALAMHLRRDWAMGGWRFPHYPPTDRSRTNGLWFSRWVNEQEVLSWRESEEPQKKSLLDSEPLWLVERGGEEVELVPNSNEPDDAVYVFWDGGLLEWVGVDRYGVIARPEVPGETSAACA